MISFLVTRHSVYYKHAYMALSFMGPRSLSSTVSAMQYGLLLYLVNIVTSHRSMSVLGAKRRLFPGTGMLRTPHYGRRLSNLLSLYSEALRRGNLHKT